MPLTELNLNPDRRVLRQFGVVALVAFGLLGGLVLWRRGLFGVDFGSATPAVAISLFSLGTLAALFSILAPRANRPLFVGLLVVTWPIGAVVSFVLLTVLFYLLITPLGLTLRLLGKRPLDVAWRREQATYWTKRAPDRRGLERYFTQY